MPAISPVRLFPDPVLRKKCETIKNFDDSVTRLAQLLVETMRAQPSGIGIAAPQIGVPKRMAIVDVSPRVPGAKRFILVNPEILKAREEVPSREGCMSIPEYSAYLKRHNWVQIRYQNLSGAHCQHTASGIEAICIQHEIDHLEGRLFIDRVACLVTDMIPRKKRT